jgi:hypothetical protein
MTVQNVVLVHGAFVDGSGWQGVHDLLEADGLNVSVVQNQTLSLESDVETTHDALDMLDGPALLVGRGSPRPWPIRSSGGGSRPSWARSATRRGAASPAGTSSPPTT